MARAVPSPHRAASPPEPQHRQEALARYKAKRDFARTPEPAAGPRAAEAGATADPLYVVQKHAARRLHYDLRLELDGVLKSWAVPAGPSLDPAERRLAVHVEDHPLDYGEFEGVIPKGQYGGGTVMLWDRGTWEPLGEPAADYAEGRLKFRLHGQKLAGGWMLVRMGGRARQEKQEPWLLIKERDAAARPGDGAPPDDDRSVLSGRRMAEIASAGDRVWRSKGTGTRAAAASAREGKRPPPMFVAPQLATLVERTPAGQEWLHEIKHDGYRCQLRIAGGGATIHTRGGHDWTARFGAIVRAAAGLPAPDSLLDGEVVVQNADGVSSFALLKQALSDGADGRMVFYAFDLLFQHGEDLRARPLLERKERLEALLAPLPAGHPIRYSDHIVGGGPEMWRMACRLGAEGSIAKRVDAPYRSGRSPSWQKIKCDNRQEVVIGGYTPLKGQGSGLGALLAGVQAAGGLVYVGKIGTGWDQAGATELLAALEPLRQEAMPFVAVPAVVRRQARWVRPELVAEVRFTGWTGDGALRHASYQGLREDRDVATVVRERPVTAADPPAARSGAPRDAAGRLVLEGVRISSPDRVVLDEPRVTKGDIARYYAAVETLL
ncbi:MAG TPA: non-homologous end-joining DNA ligase, partial [Geminicoccaceae bacterium]|nr:non-homologous end-joining DNA ligase [Geminicoccaceae bacterium]